MAFQKDGFPERIAILGSTGSVGTQALSVAKAHGLSVPFLSANRSVSSAEEQVRAFRPRLFAMSDPSSASDLRLRIRDTDTEVLSGEEGVLEGIDRADADVFVNSILGQAGLLPTLAALKTGKRLALSNKESLVIAGELVKQTAREHGAELLPVDSEHSAIFQCLHAGQKNEVKSLILTASGGPFFGYTRRELSGVTKQRTLAHPTWKMGEKITVDSASLMNKGFELIEAVHLFDVAPENVQVVIHRESIIHSAVEYIDNTVIAQLSLPDMANCVQYALTYPHRGGAVTPPLSLSALGTLSFAEPDPEAFPLLPLAGRAIAAGGASPAFLNAADEVAVAAFLREEISFLRMVDVISEVMEEVGLSARADTLEELLNADRCARKLTEEKIRKA